MGNFYIREDNVDEWIELKNDLARSLGMQEDGQDISLSSDTNNIFNETNYQRVVNLLKGCTHDGDYTTYNFIDESIFLRAGEIMRLNKVSHSTITSAILSLLNSSNKAWAIGRLLEIEKKACTSISVLQLRFVEAMKELNSSKSTNTFFLLEDSLNKMVSSLLFGSMLRLIRDIATKGKFAINSNTLADTLEDSKDEKVNLLTFYAVAEPFRDIMFDNTFLGHDGKVRDELKIESVLSKVFELVDGLYLEYLEYLLESGRLVAEYI